MQDMSIGTQCQRMLTSIPLLFLTLALCPSAAAQTARLERAEPVMGTLARIVIDAESGADTAAAFQAAFARIREIEQRLSDYLDDSEARRLEGTPLNTPTPVSHDLAAVLTHALALARDSGGAFDPTIGRATRTWRLGGGGGAGGRYRDVEVRGGTVTLRASGIAFDFGGIGKGYAADEALQVLRRHGFPRAMVAIGGDIALGDAPTGRPGWRIGIGAADDIRDLARCGVSTSGDAHQTRRGQSHILDARTGAARRARPGSVTVIAPTAMEADALATALHVMGKEEAEKRLLPKARISAIFRDF